MKKLSFAMSAMACAALVLSGCGNSVSDPCSPASSNPHSAVEPVQRRCRAPSSAPKQNPACHPKQAGKRGLSALDGAGGVNHGSPRAGNRHAVNQLGTNALGECSRQT